MPQGSGSSRQGWSVSTRLRSFCILECCSLRELPPGMECLTQLQTLGLGTGNDLQGPPLPLNIMSRLTRLDVVTFSRTVGPWPVDFSSIPSLQHLTIRAFDADVCFQDGPILPEGITGIPGLRALHLRNFPYLLSLPDWLSGLDRLEELRIYNLGITSLPSSITQLQSLRLLHLERCRALTELPEEVALLSGLQDLKLADVVGYHPGNCSLPCLTPWETFPTSNA